MWLPLFIYLSQRRGHSRSVQIDYTRTFALAHIKLIWVIKHGSWVKKWTHLHYKPTGKLYKFFNYILRPHSLCNMFKHVCKVTNTQSLIFSYWYFSYFSGLWCWSIGHRSGSLKLLHLMLSTPDSGLLSKCWMFPWGCENKISQIVNHFPVTGFSNETFFKEKNWTTWLKWEFFINYNIL